MNWTVMFVRDYRINSRKSLVDAETRWNRHLKPFFGGMRAIDVTSEQLARYVDKRQQEDAANATINRELAALKRMLRLGQQSTPPKVVRAPKFPKLAENNIRTGFLEDRQYRKLIEYCPSFGSARWSNVVARMDGESRNCFPCALTSWTSHSA
jgi:hypothetical protein